MHDSGRGQVLMINACLHLVYDELTAIVRCLNSRFRAISVRRSNDIVCFLTLNYTKKIQIVEP